MRKKHTMKKPARILSDILSTFLEFLEETFRALAWFTEQTARVIRGIRRTSSQEEVSKYQDVTWTNLELSETQMETLQSPLRMSKRGQS